MLFDGGRLVRSGSPAEAADFEGDKVAFIRRQVGKDVKVMLDGHIGNSLRTWDRGTALAVMKALEPYDLFFFEEPLHYTDPWGDAELGRRTVVPIAGAALDTHYHCPMAADHPLWRFPNVILTPQSPARG